MTANISCFSSRAVLVISILVNPFAFADTAEPLQVAALEEVRVWGKPVDNQSTGYTGPTSILTPEDLQSINIATTEDVVKYEPSLIVRRRFIGDANGTLGMRGSNMFQTSRSMVFADGVPLHYLLKSRWDGAPRWTMVSASEIARVDIIYGPFSAEYSGNAMGGVIIIETAIPQDRTFHIDGSFFSQAFNAYGFDDTVDGYKGFLSYGDKNGNFSTYFSYNHLENESQPQSFYYGANSSGATPTPASGAIAGNDESGNARLYFGDTGIIDTATDNYKFKAGYEMNDWFTLLNVAYEDRTSQSFSPNSYVRDNMGNTLWSGDVIQDGQEFSIPANRLSVSEFERQSLSLGLRLIGNLTDSIMLESSINQFDIVNDENRTSAVNSADPAYTPAGQITDSDNSGWQTAEIKLLFSIPEPGNFKLISGVRHEVYKLNTHVYNSNNYLAGNKDELTASSGGETGITAFYVQANRDIGNRWDTTLGGRFESWQSRNGYYANDDTVTPELDIQHLPARSKDQFSPKFSLGYKPSNKWTLRYSWARAYRFPIVEELFSQYQAYNAVSVANPELKPENGLHHNLLLERSLEQGYLRLNFFKENIKDVIEAQATVLPGGVSVRTFIPVDEVETHGIELIANAENLWIENLDMRFNIVYTDAKIIRNDADPDIEGNIFPRMPKWRANLLATYHIFDRWDIGGSVQYAGDSYGKLDNTDNEDKVFNAQDGYMRVGLKTTYRLNEHTGIGFGIDNISNEIAYVAHPWPGRTYYMNVSYDL